MIPTGAALKVNGQGFTVHELQVDGTHLVWCVPGWLEPLGERGRLIVPADLLPWGEGSVGRVEMYGRTWRIVGSDVSGDARTFPLLPEAS